MTVTAAPPSALLCVGQFAGAHGVRGLVRLRSFTADPLAILDYAPLLDQTGTHSFHLTQTGNAKDALIVKVQGVADRDAALALTGTRLYIPRDRLPEPEGEDEFYYADLIGCRAELSDGTLLGRVRAVHDFGAGEMLELERDGVPTVMMPFTKVVVPVIDIASRRLVVAPPAEIIARDDEPEGEAP